LYHKHLYKRTFACDYREVPKCLHGKQATFEDSLDLHTIKQSINLKNSYKENCQNVFVN